MSRKYVIMRENQFTGEIIPYDVISSMTRAEELTILLESQAPKESGYIYYWNEVISSED